MSFQFGLECTRDEPPRVATGGGGCPGNTAVPPQSKVVPVDIPRCPP
jgi:hypothetical protein